MRRFIDYLALLAARARSDESGQGLVEYALILVLVAIVVIVLLALLGDNVRDIFTGVGCEMEAAGNIYFEGCSQ